MNQHFSFPQSTQAGSRSATAASSGTERLHFPQGRSVDVTVLFRKRGGAAVSALLPQAASVDHLHLFSSPAQQQLPGSFFATKEWRRLNTRAWTTRTAKTSCRPAGRRGPPRMAGSTTPSESNPLSVANRHPKVPPSPQHKAGCAGLDTGASTSCMLSI